MTGKFSFFFLLLVSVRVKPQIVFPDDPVYNLFPSLTSTKRPERIGSPEVPANIPNHDPNPNTIPSPNPSPLNPIPTPNPRPLNPIHSPNPIPLNPIPSPNPSPLNPIHSPNPIPSPNPAPIHDSIHTQRSPSSQPSILPSECGIPYFGSRVVGGNITEPGEWPWLAALGNKIDGKFVSSCGGSLFTTRHVLTAQHCFAGIFKPNTVRLGEYDFGRTDDVPDTQDFAIAQRLAHDYNPNTYENDIVIIVLDRHVEFTNYIQPICLPFNQQDSDLADKTLVVTGWGKTDFKTQSFVSVPLDAVVPLVERSQCAQSYSHFGGRVRPAIDNRQLCAGDGTTDSCSGDSGGPLQYVDQDGQYKLAGIVSFGYECANSNYPGVYTMVSSFIPWIMDKIQ